MPTTLILPEQCFGAGCRGRVQWLFLNGQNMGELRNSGGWAVWDGRGDALAHECPVADQTVKNKRFGRWTKGGTFLSPPSKPLRCSSAPTKIIACLVAEGDKMAWG